MDLKGSFKNLFKKIFKKPSIKFKKPSIKLSKKKIIIIGGVVAIIIIGSGIMFFLKSGKDETAKDQEVENIQINEIDYDNVIVLKEFTWIKLKGTSHLKRVSIGIALELVSKDSKKSVEAKTEMIRTLVRKMLREKKWIELRTPEGKIKFKYMLIKNINLLFPDIVIRNLYLTHFIMR
ncbi:MAG: flagellar basal body-associated FliL family protein [Desulfobacteraceae bacterium]|nr:flagellar basal body-associated FliL family protein [Desulfobacteraceae bacterium]